MNYTNRISIITTVLCNYLGCRAFPPPNTTAVLHIFPPQCKVHYRNPSCNANLSAQGYKRRWKLSKKIKKATQWRANKQKQNSLTLER